VVPGMGNDLYKQPNAGCANLVLSPHSQEHELHHRSMIWAGVFSVVTVHRLVVQLTSSLVSSPHQNAKGLK
jgi:hypothetical protein